MGLALREWGVRDSDYGLSRPKRKRCNYGFSPPGRGGKGQEGVSTAGLALPEERGGKGC